MTKQKVKKLESDYKKFKKFLDKFDVLVEKDPKLKKLKTKFMKVFSKAEVKLDKALKQVKIPKTALTEAEENKYSFDESIKELLDENKDALTAIEKIVKVILLGIYKIIPFKKHKSVHTVLVLVLFCLIVLVLDILIGKLISKYVAKLGTAKKFHPALTGILGFLAITVLLGPLTYKLFRGTEKLTQKKGLLVDSTVSFVLVKVIMQGVQAILYSDDDNLVIFLIKVVLESFIKDFVEESVADFVKSDAYKKSVAPIFILIVGFLSSSTLVHEIGKATAKMTDYEDLGFDED